MFKNITKKFTEYVCENNANKFANLFSEEGVYHDYIYGSFKGKKNIKSMLANYFHRDAENFYWEMYDHVFNKNIGYAKYRFTFTSKIPIYFGKKVVLAGICFFRFKSNLILEYSESVNGGIAMVQLGVNPQKIKNVFVKWFKRTLEDDPRLKSLQNKVSN